MPPRDHYKVLGVPRAATGEDVRRAYRRLARQYHPDANPDDPATEERFKEVQQAYEILSDPNKRREYDARSRPSARQTSGASRQGAGSRPRQQTTGSVDLSDLLRKSGGNKEVDWQLRGQDIARIAKILGVDLTRISKLLGENIKMSTNVSFGHGRPGNRETTGEHAPTQKPPKPRKPPKPPKTRKPDDA